MAIKYISHKSGKGRIQVGERNNAEWHELMKTASGCVGITSVNHRAAQHARWKEQGAKAPEPEGDHKG